MQREEIGVVEDPTAESRGLCEERQRRQVINTKAKLCKLIA